jgi:PKD repeat protein
VIAHRFSRLKLLSLFSLLSAVVPAFAVSSHGKSNHAGTAASLSVSGSATPTSGTTPLTVTFSSVVSGGTAPYAYTWTFGDGGTSTSQNPSYLYKNAGTYAPTLTVHDSSNQTATASWTILVTAPTTVSISISPTSATVSSASTAQFTANVTGSTNAAVTWSASAGTISSTGLLTAPSVTSTTTVTVTATSQADTTKSASANLTVNSTSTATSSAGKPLFGTTSSPMNLPIASWNVGVDTAATSDLQAALRLSSYSQLYWTIGDDSFATYYATSSDPSYTLADASGNAKSCTGGGGTVYTTVHLPSVVTSSWNGVYNTTNDQHLSVVDLTNNQIFAFYSSSGDHLGIYNGKWESDYRGCDYLANPNGDAAVATAVANRFSCTGFPCANIAGVGAGVGIGGTAASDRNAFMSPYGDIMPQDFDDTGWTGDAIGTLHHALYTIIPSGYIANAVWPTPNEGGTNRNLKNGQIIQLDPYACGGTQFDLSCFAPNDQRIAKTLMVYGAVISDFGSYGPKFSGQFSGRDGNGVTHFANPWTPAGTPGLSQAAYTEINNVTANGAGNVIYNSSISAVLSKLRVLAAHGPTY